MSGAILRLTPIYGVHSEDALCYMLEIDDCRILLDCGWDERFSLDFIQPLAKVAASIDFVLLSHPDLLHLGALPYAFAKLGLDCPVVATMPVMKLGQLFLKDACKARIAREDFDTFSLTDIDDAFSQSRFVHLRFSETYNLTGNGSGISVEPHEAGHMLGGTIWKITKDTEDIVYAVDCNKIRERMLKGTVLGSLGTEIPERPALLITDAFNAQYVLKTKRGMRDTELLDSAVSTLQGGGNVLMPVDTAGRVFELMLVLEDRWRSARLTDQYPLVLLHSEADTVVEYAKMYTEWMHPKCKFAETVGRAFNFRTSLDDLGEFTSQGPVVVLASCASLETGFSRDLFFRWAPNPRNCVLFTTRTHPDTLARLLVDYSLQRQPPPRFLPLQHHVRVELEGEELEAFQAKQKVEREEREKVEREVREKKEAELAQVEIDIDSDEEDKIKTEELVEMAMMFPSIEISQTFDEYGGTIDHKDYMDEEELARVQNAAAAETQWEAQQDVHQEVRLPRPCSFNKCWQCSHHGPCEMTPVPPFVGAADQMCPADGRSEAALQNEIRRLRGSLRRQRPDRHPEDCEPAEISGRACRQRVFGIPARESQRRPIRIGQEHGVHADRPAADDCRPDLQSVGPEGKAQGRLVRHGRVLQHRGWLRRRLR